MGGRNARIEARESRGVAGAALCGRTLEGAPPHTVLCVQHFSHENATNLRYDP